MATAVPLFGGGETPPAETLPLQLGSSKRVLSVDQHGRSQLVTPPRSREDPSEFSPIPLKHLESSTNAPTSSPFSSVGTNVGLMSRDELDQLVAKEDSEDLKRVVQHAVALESLRQVERAEYLNQLEQAKRKIAQLESELATLPAFYTSSSHLDLARLEGENDQLLRQSIALARKLQHAKTTQSDRRQGRPEGEETLRSENRKLWADVKYLERRLTSNENETSRLTSELRRLRSYYLQGAPLIVHDAEIVLPPEGATKAGSRAVLLGDAEAELLLQAGKVCSHVRRVQRIPLDKAIQEQAEEIVQAIVPFPLDPPQSAPASPARSRVPSSYSYSVTPVSYQLPVPPSLRGYRTNANSLSFNVVANRDNHDSIPSTSSIPFDAESVGLPDPPPSFASSTYSDLPRTSETVETSLDKTSPSATALLELPTVRPVTGTTSGARVRPPASVPTRRVVASDSPLNIEGIASNEIDTAGGAGPLGKPVGRTPSALDLLSEAAGAMRSSNDPEPYNPRSRKPKLDANGEKKARSPYIKWNVDEDEQLLNAVIACGCAWDSVAKLCPTRAYHQVRQRFLRGLRSGDTLPPELMHLQPAVKKAVADYEARKKRKKPRQSSVGSSENNNSLPTEMSALQYDQDEQMDGYEDDEDAMQDG
ncbi:hypothetical protein JCM3765_002463 [Sporobolomyces pararoseus]